MSLSHSAFGERPYLWRSGFEPWSEGNRDPSHGPNRPSRRHRHGANASSSYHAVAFRWRRFRRNLSPRHAVALCRRYRCILQHDNRGIQCSKHRWRGTFRHQPVSSDDVGQRSAVGLGDHPEGGHRRRRLDRTASAAAPAAGWWRRRRLTRHPHHPASPAHACAMPTRAGAGLYALTFGGTPRLLYVGSAGVEA